MRLQGSDEPSPFTRTGLGINGAIKPDLVHYGGNLLFEGFGNNVRRIRTENPNAGTGVMSFSHEPLDRLFSFRVGTSQAAPPVARIAALIWNQLKAAVEGPGSEPGAGGFGELGFRSGGCVESNCGDQRRRRNFTSLRLWPSRCRTGVRIGRSSRRH